MILLKRTGLYLLIIVFIIVSVGYLLPRTVTVHSSKIIPAPARFVFSQISDFHCWENWMPWLQMDTSLQISINTLPGSDSGIAWNSLVHKHAKGSARILESYPDSLLMLQLDFKNHTAVQVQFFISELADSVKVNWNMEFDLGNNPFKRYPGLFLNTEFKKELEKGLSLLDSVAQLAPRN